MDSTWFQELSKSETYINKRKKQEAAVLEVYFVITLWLEDEAFWLRWKAVGDMSAL